MSRIDAFFKLMAEQQASDLHLATNNPPMLRIHGDLVRVDYPPLKNDELKAMVYEIAPEGKIKIFEETSDIDFGYEVPGMARYRANFFQQKYGISAVFRLIPSNVLTVEDLGLPAVLKKFPMLKKGLVLVTGPTGSGKSTTLAALMDYINENFSRHIVTIEEPIEFVHGNKRSIITQREIPADSESFPVALKAALREDADIVLVGEMRDLETVSLALTAAETGLLVFGTLHTNNARKTVDRMVDVFPAPKQPQARAMLANSLRGVLAQLLLKKADGSGRVAVNEILIANPAVSAIIREGATQKLQDVIVSGKGQGMQFMDDAILTLLKSGTVTAHEAFMKAIDKNRFKEFLSAEEQRLGDAAGAAPDDEKKLPGNFMKKAAARSGARPPR